MLKKAILYEDQLKKKYMEAACDDYFKFYFSTSYRNFKLNICDDDWWTIQAVSIDKNNNVIGFMTADASQDSRVVKCLGIMNFTKSPNLVFAKDLLMFLRDLRDRYGAIKFEFSAFVGSDAEKMYQKFIEKHGGRVVGTFKNSSRLADGEYYDSRVFEIMRDEMNF